MQKLRQVSLGLYCTDQKHAGQCLCDPLHLGGRVIVGDTTSDNSQALSATPEPQASDSGVVPLAFCPALQQSQL